MAPTNYKPVDYDGPKDPSKRETLQILLTGSAATLLFAGCTTTKDIAQVLEPPIPKYPDNTYATFNQRLTADIRNKDIFSKILGQYLPKGISVEAYLNQFADALSNKEYDPAVVRKIKHPGGGLEAPIILDIGTSKTQKGLEELQTFANMVPSDTQYKYANSILIGYPQRTGHVSAVMTYSQSPDHFGLIKVTPTTKTFKGEKHYNVSVSFGTVESLEGLVKENITFPERVKDVTRSTVPLLAAAGLYALLSEAAIGGLVIAGGVIHNTADNVQRVGRSGLPVYVETNKNISRIGNKRAAIEDFTRFHFKTSEKVWNLNYDNYLIAPRGDMIIKVDSTIDSVRMTDTGVVEISTHVNENYLKSMLGAAFIHVLEGLPVFLAYKYAQHKFERDDGGDVRKPDGTQTGGDGVFGDQQ